MTIKVAVIKSLPVLLKGETMAVGEAPISAKVTRQTGHAQHIPTRGHLYHLGVSPWDGGHVGKGGRTVWMESDLWAGAGGGISCPDNDTTYPILCIVQRTRKK